MDKDIEDIKRRAGLLTEAEASDMSPYEDLDTLLKSETKFLENLMRVLARTLAPAHRAGVLGLINNRNKKLGEFHKEKVEKPMQQQQQNQQQRNFQQAEQEKAGGQRRP